MPGRRPQREQRGAPALLAVHAHPDDETLSNGALLATWAAAGWPAAVVTCTRGEQGEVIGSELAHLEGDGPGLAARRERELAGALTALGVRDHVFLDQVHGPGDVAHPARYVDSGMAWVGAGSAAAAAELPVEAFVSVPLDEASARLAAVLRDRRPDVVVGYGPGGGYGHPDHVHAHRVMHRAVELAADEHEVSVVLWTVLDEGSWRTACAALGGDLVDLGADRALTAPDPAGPAPAAAVPSDEVDVTVEVPPVLDRLLAALNAHATQVQAVSRWEGSPTAVARFALSNRILQPVLRAETYRLAPRGATAGRTDRTGRAALVDRARGIEWPAGVRVDGG